MTVIMDKPEAATETADQGVPERTDRYPVSVEEYRTFKRDDFLVVRGLVSPAEIVELRQHTEDLMQGRLPEQNRTDQRRRQAGAWRRRAGAWKHRRSICPRTRRRSISCGFICCTGNWNCMSATCCIRAFWTFSKLSSGRTCWRLQTMLFLKPPGKPGQGWHQDRFYIPTHPDTLCGAWIAIDDTR